jgi:hypothetical protein
VVRTVHYAPNRHDTGSTTARSVDEVALIQDPLSHYAPVLIAPLSKSVAPAVSGFFSGASGEETAHRRQLRRLLRARSSGARCGRCCRRLLRAITKHRATLLRCVAANAHAGRRRPTPEITCSVLDSIPGARDVATHNDILRCNMGCFPCVIPARFLPVFGRFEANSKVFLHRPERRRLALA